MYQDRILLSSKDILEHEFKFDTRGYRPQEVDKYLDMVIRDYVELLKTIKSLEEENDNLAEDNRKLQAEYRKLREEIDASDSVGSSRNTDLLRRISNLEKIVYGRE